MEKQFISVKGLEGKYCNNPAEALMILANFRPDLIISDMEMPRMNGEEFMIKVKEGPELRHIPIFFLTAHADRDRIKLFRSGAAGVIKKPFTPKLLHSDVQKLFQLL